MNLKDKISILILAGLIIGVSYIWYTYTEITERMNQMETEQLTHVDQVNKEFRKDLKTLNLQFIGRGKHVRKAQKDIIANHELILSKSVLSIFHCHRLLQLQETGSLYLLGCHQA